MDGIAIVRMNPMSTGHKFLIDGMLSSCDRVFIGLGSCQESETVRNPYTPKQREIMIRNVYPDKNVIIFFLDDLGSCSKSDWTNYCLTELHRQVGYDANPSIYYGGCEADVDWWSEAVNLKEDRMKTVSLCRDDNHHISATEIRKSLRDFLNGNKSSIEWISHIPEQNIDFVKENYPKYLLDN